MSLIAHYPLNGNILDYSGNNLHATNNYAAVYNNGKIGKCYTFTQMGNDGINITQTNLTQLQNNYSMSIWVNPAGTHWHYNGAFISSGNWNGSYWSFGVSQDNTQIDVLGRGCNQWIPYTLPLNTWTHLTCVASNNITKLYANGVYIGERSTPSSLVSDATNTFIGRETYASGYFSFNGKINDVRIYDHALSEKEIKEIYKTKILHYNFNDFQEPTTNLVTSQDFSTNWGGSSPPISISNGVATFREGNGDRYWFNTYDFGTIVEGRTFTASCKMKTIDCEKNKGILIYWQNSSNGFIFQNNYADFSVGLNSQEYKNLSITAIAPVGATKVCFFIGLGYTAVSDTNGLVYIKECMLEEKNHYTPYVNGSRTGQVQDSSGHGNHAVLNATNTPQWTESSKWGNGGYIFTPLKNDITTALTDSKSISCETIGLPNDQFTISFWTYRTNFGYNGGSFFRLGGYNDSGIDTFDHNLYLYSSGTSIANLAFSPTLNTWSHNVIVFNRSTLTLSLYMNGVFVRSASVTDSPIYNISNKLDIGVAIAGGVVRCYNGTMDDFRIYATAFSEANIKELYEVGQSIHNTGSLETNQFIENGYNHNLIQYNKWVVGNYVLTTNWSQYSGWSTQYTSKIINGINPLGQSDILYECKSLDNYTFVTNQNHGLKSSISTTIDVTKKYRASCWVYIDPTTTGTYLYQGYINGICNFNTTTVNSNPYYKYFPPDVINKGIWLLIVAYIYPYNSTGNINEGHTYKVDGTVHSTTDAFNWDSTVTNFYMRYMFNYQTGTITKDQYSYMYRPRFDLCDGDEPTLQELLKCQDHKTFPLLQPEFSSKHLVNNNYFKEAFTSGITYIKDDSGNTKQLYCEYTNGQVYAKSNSTSFIVKGVTFNNVLQIINTNTYYDRVVANMDSNTIYINKMIEN